MDGWAVGRFGPGPDVITLTSLTYVRTLEPTVALDKGVKELGPLVHEVVRKVGPGTGDLGRTFVRTDGPGGGSHPPRRFT